MNELEIALLTLTGLLAIYSLYLRGKVYIITCILNATRKANSSLLESLDSWRDHYFDLHSAILPKDEPKLKDLLDAFKQSLVEMSSETDMDKLDIRRHHARIASQRFDDALQKYHTDKSQTKQ